MANTHHNENDHEIFALIYNWNYTELRRILDTVVIKACTYNNTGHTPLTYACFVENEIAVDMLLKYNHRCDEKDKNGKYPIHYAAESSRENILKILLNNKANINTKGKGGEGALHFAIRKERITIVKLLMDWGIDMNVSNRRSSMCGTNVMDLVNEVGSETIHQMLQKNVPKSKVKGVGRRQNPHNSDSEDYSDTVVPCTCLKEVQKLTTTIEEVKLQIKHAEEKSHSLENLAKRVEVIEEKVNKIEKVNSCPTSKPVIPMKPGVKQEFSGTSLENISSQYIRGSRVLGTELHRDIKNTDHNTHVKSPSEPTFKDHNTYVKSPSDPMSTDHNTYVKSPSEPTLRTYTTLVQESKKVDKSKLRPGQLGSIKRPNKARYESEAGTRNDKEDYAQINEVDMVDNSSSEDKKQTSVLQKSTKEYNRGTSCPPSISTDSDHDIQRAIEVSLDEKLTEAEKTNILKNLQILSRNISIQTLKKSLYERGLVTRYEYMEYVDDQNKHLEFLIMDKIIEGKRRNKVVLEDILKEKGYEVYIQYLN